MKKILGLIVPVLLLTLVLAGCNSSYPAGSSNSTPATPTQSPTNTPTPTPVNGEIILSEATNRVSPYIVQIIFGASNDDWQTLTMTAAIGSGLLVNRDGYVITASHVIDLGEQYMQQINASNKKLRIVIPSYEGLSWSNQAPKYTSNDFDIVAKDEKHDLALLKIKMQYLVNPLGGNSTSSIAQYSGGAGGALLINPIPLDNNYKIKTTDILGVSGYPVAQGLLGHALRWPDLVTETGHISPAELSSIKNAHLVGELGSVTTDIADCYRTDISINPGNSGGPVYLIGDGSIIGMGVSTSEIGVYVNTSVVTLVIPARYITDLLNSNGINWTKVDREYDWDNPLGPLLTPLR